MSTLKKGISQKGQFERNSSAHLVQPQRSAKTFPAEIKKKEKKQINDEKNTNNNNSNSNNWLFCCGSVSDVNHGTQIKQVEVASNLGAVQE